MPSKVSSISCHFLLWETVSQTGLREKFYHGVRRPVPALIETSNLYNLFVTLYSNQNINETGTMLRFRNRLIFNHSFWLIAEKVTLCTLSPEPQYLPGPRYDLPPLVHRPWSVTKYCCSIKVKRFAPFKILGWLLYFFADKYLCKPVKTLHAAFAVRVRCA